MATAARTKPGPDTRTMEKQGGAANSPSRRSGERGRGGEGTEEGATDEKATDEGATESAVSVVSAVGSSEVGMVSEICMTHTSSKVKRKKEESNE